MASAVEDVQQRHRQRYGGGITGQMPPEGAAGCRYRRRARRGHRYGQQGVGAQIALVGGAVQLNQTMVNGGLVIGGHSGQRRGDAVVDIGNGG